jgi:hypothetical protein
MSKKVFCDGCNKDLTNQIPHKMIFFDIEDLCADCFNIYVYDAWKVRNKLKGLKL